MRDAYRWSLLFVLLALEVHCGPGTMPTADADAAAADATATDVVDARDAAVVDATTADAVRDAFDALDVSETQDARDVASVDQPAVDARVDEGVDAGPGARRVFVSSAQYDGAFAGSMRDDAGMALGQAAGDALCQTLASAAGLGGRWVAWLSTRDADAIDHVAGAGPWITTGGRVAFPDRASLAAVPLVPVDRDETGAAVDAAAIVWTGTATGGRRVPRDASNDTHNCYSWGYAGTDRFTGGGVGSVALVASWTRSTTVACNRMARLYCFEQ